MGKRGMMELHKRKLWKGIKTSKLKFYKYCVLDYVHIEVWGQYRQHRWKAVYILWVLLMTTHGKFGCTS